jgi:hypothetical protein
MKRHSSCSGDTRVDFTTPQTDQDHARARTHFPDCPTNGRSSVEDHSGYVSDTIRTIHPDSPRYKNGVMLEYASCFSAPHRLPFVYSGIVPYAIYEDVIRS